jgi:glycosyltransferase involved in cell wall biosynthesis
MKLTLVNGASGEIVSAITTQGSAAGPMAHADTHHGPERTHVPNRPDWRHALTGTAVVIPAFNEARTIRSVVNEVLAQGIERLIVVDDGSQDGTENTLTGLPIELHRHSRNQGKGFALMTGMQRALALGSERVITLDADGQHQAADIARLLDASLVHPQALVIAARLRGRERAPRVRRFANTMADFWISWACGRAVADTQSGYRLYPSTLLRRLTTWPRRDQGFAFESALLIDAAAVGADLKSIPIETLYCPIHRASHYRPWRDTWSIVQMVGGRLLGRGFYPLGLLRALGFLSQLPQTEGAAVDSSPH